MRGWVVYRVMSHTVLAGGRKRKRLVEVPMHPTKSALIDEGFGLQSTGENALWSSCSGPSPAVGHIYLLFIVTGDGEKAAISPNNLPPARIPARELPTNTDACLGFAAGRALLSRCLLKTRSFIRTNGYVTLYMLHCRRNARDSKCLLSLTLVCHPQPIAHGRYRYDTHEYHKRASKQPHRSRAVETILNETNN